ncbi:YihY/virulence factor BrkB family protein [Puerhibacterium puerhi]|uniref:YihY/virulence factor BrkB family protein n=1 Tax=Puerhibacterium puerhi TaxID=2692623 RepID=UPI001359B546|nr:YhjD/YihY/BrkB family envelope integrity protein [Puerhibacterium puerhi]
MTTSSGSAAPRRPSAFARTRTRVEALLERWQDTRPGRAVAWYGARRGGQLSGGIAYSALFSLFALLTIGWTIFSSVLGVRGDLRDAVLAQLDVWIPNLVGYDEQRDVLSPEELVLPTALTVPSVVSVVVLLVSGTGVMGALRASVRAMFGVPSTDDNAVLARLWQLAGFFVLGAGIVLSAAASVVSRVVGAFVRDVLGGSVLVGLAIAVGGAVVGVVVDALIVAGVVVVVGGVRPARRRDLVLGCLAAGVVAGVLRWLGASVVVGSANRNPLLTSFATLVTILVLVNFVARVLLLVCAWMHDPPRVDELHRAELELAARRHAAEVDRLVRQGQGSGLPWSPVVRGYRRALLR